MQPDAAEADALFRAHQDQIYRRTDRLFAHLMVAQWVAGIVFALWVSPRAWTGSTSQTHVHVWAAVLLGGAISLFPALLALLRPGRAVDALHDRHRTDADERAAHPPDRRPHRDALPRLRLARVPRLLSRLARARPSDRRRRARSLPARHLLAAVGLRRASSPASGAGSSTRRGSSSRTSCS